MQRRDFLRQCSGAAAALVSVDAVGWGSGRHSEKTQVAPDLDRLRAEFPLLNERISDRMLSYLDNAATTQRPKAVLSALSAFYEHNNANPGKSLHALAKRSRAEYDQARVVLARFINARETEEVVWTRGTTEAINLVASSWGGQNLRAGDEILLTVAEHYSNLVPWQLAAHRANASLRILDIEDDGQLRMEELDVLLSNRTKLVTVSHVSNALGFVNPVRMVCDRAHRVGALVLVDGAQSVPHFPVDVQELGCDFFAFSGHKMLGPMGIGVLWARREILDLMPPFQAGSNMVHDVELDSSALDFAEGCLKFEAGTPNVPGAVGLAAAVGFLKSLGQKKLWTQEQELTKYALRKLAELDGIRLLGPTEAKDRVSLFSFQVRNRSPLEVVKALDEAGIAVRGGDLACRPLLKRLGCEAAVRASCYVYTSFEEIDRLASELKRLI